MSPSVRSKPLTEFLPLSVAFSGNAEIRVSGISTDSRSVARGDLFVAKTGLQQRGSQYIKEAVNKGALAVLTDDADVQSNAGDMPLAYLPELDKNLSAIAGDFFDQPSAKLSVTGVTGTNGKTSCCYWYAWMSNRLGTACGQIGTLGAGYTKGSQDSLTVTGMTTPDAVQVQKLLAEVYEAGASAVVMEVSSHGLDQGRVEAVEFESAIFTNLSQDHLDYHRSMDEYFTVKASLFRRSELRRVVLNRDDPTFDRLVSSLRADTELYTYSLSQQVADLFFREINWTGRGAEVVFDGRWGEARAIIPVIGEYNLSNLLAVLAALLSAGHEMESLIEAIEALPSVPGRMELISRPGCARVVVDYAHTPDAVVSALQALRSQVSGKLIAVLGCGGDRDRSKRPLMGSQAFEHADECWFTSDNPRSEHPADIIAEMMTGIDSETDSEKIRVEERRDQAIKSAIETANEQDLVVVLGKGHEAYQEVAGVKHPFNDVDYCEQALDQLLATKSKGGAE